MNLKQRYNLFLHRQLLSPKREFKATLERQLLVRFDARWGTAVVWYQTHLFRLGTAIMSGILVVSSVTTSVYAYTSPEVTSSSILYPLKQSLETIEEKTKTTPTAKAAFLLKKIQRREAEKEVMTAQHQSVEAVDNAIQDAAVHLAELEHEIVVVSSTPVVETAHLREKIEAKIEAQAERWSAREAKLMEHQRELEQMMQTETQQAVETSTSDMIEENAVTTGPFGDAVEDQPGTESEAQADVHDEQKGNGGHGDGERVRDNADRGEKEHGGGRNRNDD